VKAVGPLFIAALFATATGCGPSPAAPNTTAGTAPGAALNLSGTWLGTGTDAQGRILTCDVV
jgi:hypothetical protein